MEMNTRIQVEHPVIITGIDLVSQLVTPAELAIRQEDVAFGAALMPHQCRRRQDSPLPVTGYRRGGARVHRRRCPPKWRVPPTTIR